MWKNKDPWGSLLYFVKEKRLYADFIDVLSLIIAFIERFNIGVIINRITLISFAFNCYQFIDKSPNSSV